MYYGKIPERIELCRAFLLSWDKYQMTEQNNEEEIN